MNKCLVEITGLPCAGKSYFCDDSEGFLNRKKKSVTKEVFSSIQFILLGTIFLKISTLYAFLMLCRYEKAPLIFRLKIFANILKKFGIFNKYRNSTVTGYIDEGISHIPFNFLHTDTVEIINILRPYLASANVKYVKAGSDICLRKRLQQRGHDRLKFLSVDELIHLNRNVEATLLVEYPHVCLTFEVLHND